MEKKNKPAINRLEKKLIKTDAPHIQGGMYNDCYFDNVGWVCRRCISYIHYRVCGSWTAMPEAFYPHPNS